MADPPLHHATTEPPPRRFVYLPTDIYEEIFKFLDIRSVSRVFKAYSALPSFEDLRRETTKYFRGKVVNVSLKHIIQSNTTEISFDLLAYLPPCDIHVECPAGLFELAKNYLRQVEYKLLSLRVQHKNCSRFFIDLNGLNGNVVALELIGVRFDASHIPVTTQSMIFSRCQVKAQPNLSYLVNLTSFTDIYCVFYCPGKLLSLRTKIQRARFDVSSIPNLKDVAGNEFLNIPWSQIETAIVRRIPSGLFCELLQEISILYEGVLDDIQPNFKTIYCPNLQKVLLHSSIRGEITDIFTTTQLAQLKLFHGDDILVRDLSLLPEAEDLRVKYDEPFTRNAVLPSKLVKLFINSSNPVDGIPSQLEYFGLYTGTTEDLTVVDSATLRELHVLSEGLVSINCPKLTHLTLANVSHIRECNVPNVECLDLILTSFSFEQVPRLRRLKMDGGWVSSLSIDPHLEYVEVKYSHLSNLLVSADDISVWQRPPSYRLFPAATFNDDYTCQQLTCNCNLKMPKLMESLIISTYFAWNGAQLERRDDLKSICIERAGSLTLAVPKNVEKLRIRNVRDPAVVHFVDTAKLEYIEYFNRDLIPLYEAGEDVIPPILIPDGFVKVGPTLWCRPDILQLWKPS